METKPTVNVAPLEERIRARAFELYVDRGNESGSELDDWLQAEEEIAAAEEEFGERD
jgi:hypothetical protein